MRYIPTFRILEMRFLLTVLISSYVSMSNTSIGEKLLTKREKQLLELKMDVDRIEDGFDNLAFDIVTEAIEVFRSYPVNGENYVSEENISNEVSTLYPVTKKILNNLLENTTQQYIGQSDEESSRASLDNILENQSKIYLKNRRERSAEDTSSNSSQNSKDKSLVESPNSSNNLCSKKGLEDQALERQHIEDLKEEVQKLNDLVVLLRDQQKIMSLLKETKDLDSDLSQKFEARDLIKILNHVNDKDASRIRRKWDEISADNITNKKSIHEELEEIKYGRKSAVDALNKTKEILTMEREKEISLENEIKDQREELAFLKTLVEKLYENNTSFFNISNPKKGNFTVHTGEILETPKVKVPGVDKKTIETKTRASTARESNAVLGGPMIKKHIARSSDFGNIEKLLDEIRQPKKDDLESRMFELKQEIDKKKQEEDLIKQAMLLQRFLSQQKEGQNLKGFSSEDSAMLKRLQEAIKNAHKPQNKSVDDEVELQLEQLQSAIENLRPRDDWAVGQDEAEKERFQKLLSRLLSQESQDEEINIAGGNRAEHLSSKQISELMKRLDQINHANAKVTGGDTFPTRNGYGYEPQFAGSPSRNYVCKIEELPQSNSDINSADLFGREPSPQFSPGGFNNFPPTYPQYPGLPNSVLNNGMSSTPGYNQFGRYYPLAGNIPHADFRNFAPNAYFGLTSFTPNQNKYGRGISHNVYQNPYIQPNRNNFSIDMKQNALQYRSDFFTRNFEMPVESSSRLHQVPITEPLPQTRYKIGSSIVPELHSPQTSFRIPPEHISAYQTPSDRPQTTYDMSVIPNNNPFDRNLRPIPYSQAIARGQNSPQKEIKNEFFHVPQLTPNAFYPQINAGEGSTDQSGVYPQQNSENVDYRHRKIEDIKTEVESLQNVIANLNKPDHIHKPEDKEIMVNLERQIKELKDIIRGLNQEMASTQQNVPNLPGYGQNGPQQQNYPKTLHRRRREFINENEIDPNENSRVYDNVSKFSQLIFDKENQTKERNRYYDDMQKRIVDLRSELEKHLHTPRIAHEHHFNLDYPTEHFPNSYQSPYLHYNKQYPTVSLEPNKNGLELKKSDLFSSIIIKIFDGLLAATPTIIEKLFGDGLTQLTNFGDFSSYSDHNNVQTLFKSFGRLAYGPLIILKIIDGFTTFVNILKRNKFIRNIFVPVLILLLVAGSVLFLIWWLQPDQEYYVSQQIDSFGDINYNKNYGEHPTSNYKNLYGYNINHYVPRRNYDYPVYSGSYFENGQRRTNFM